MTCALSHKQVPGPKNISAKQQSFDTKIAKQSATTSTLSKPVTLQGSQGITETDDTIVPTTDIPSTEICKHPTGMFSDRQLQSRSHVRNRGTTHFLG